MAAAELFLRSGFVDRYFFSVKRAAVEFFNCFGCAFFRFHLDKTESFGLAAEFILDDRRGDHFSRFGKIGFQVIACDLIRQIADV